MENALVQEFSTVKDACGRSVYEGHVDGPSPHATSDKMESYFQLDHRTLLKPMKMRGRLQSVGTLLAISKL